VIRGLRGLPQEPVHPVQHIRRVTATRLGLARDDMKVVWEIWVVSK
jgi:hypothetical protein